MDQPYSLPPEVQAALDKGRFVEAIKLLRNSGSGLDLKGAKEAIEEHMRARRAGTAAAPSMPTPQPGAPHDFGAVKNGDFTRALGGPSPGQVSGGGGRAWWITLALIAGLVALAGAFF